MVVTVTRRPVVKKSSADVGHHRAVCRPRRPGGAARSLSQLL